jgi:hypothetical protein
MKNWALGTIGCFIAISILIAGPGPAAAAEDVGGKLLYDDYSYVLKKYVSTRGTVDYAALKFNGADYARLNGFVTSLGAFDRAVYDGWSADYKIAFLINAYNAFVLKTIMDNYPIEPTVLRSTLYPENSIRQIRGVFSELKFRLMGTDVTLDDIEHRNLRVKFDEPRIHVALVCAAMGCPRLRAEPYYGARIDKQLDDQVRTFCSDPDKFRIDRENSEVHLSEIFKWFGEDFILQYGTNGNLEGFGEKERAVLNFIMAHVNERDSKYLSRGGYRIKYIKYDWTLNEKR